MIRSEFPYENSADYFLLIDKALFLQGFVVRDPVTLPLIVDYRVKKILPEPGACGHALPIAPVLIRSVKRPSVV